MFFASSSLK